MIADSDILLALTIFASTVIVWGVGGLALLFWLENIPIGRARKENEEWHKRRKEWVKEFKEENKRRGLDENYLVGWDEENLFKDDEK